MNHLFTQIYYFAFFSISEFIVKTNCFIFILKLEQSLVSLDLGGGSTQITFYPRTNRVEGLEGRKHFLHDVNVLQNLIKVSPLYRYVLAYLLRFI